MPTTLRGLVYDKYPSISAFAKDIGWQRGKATRIINEQQQPTKKDMEDMIRVLDIAQTAVASVFFGRMFT